MKAGVGRVSVFFSAWRPAHRSRGAASASLLRLLCLMPVGLLWSGRLPAQHSLDSVQLIEEVTVTAVRHREIIPAQRLSGEKLEALGSFSVADAIRYFSGVQIKDYGGVGGLKTVDIRSMGTHHMGVFYDGIQLGNAQNGQIDLGKFSLDNIEEIALHNGQKSDIFQSAKDYGSAGVIYLRTRRPRFAPGRKTNLKAVFRSGSFGLVNPSLLWEQQLGRQVSSSLNVEYIYASGKYPFRYRRVFPDGTVAWDTTAVRRNGDIHSLRMEGGLNGYTLRGKWNLKGYFYDSEKGIPGAIVNNVWKRSQRQWDRNFFVQGNWREQMFRDCELLVNMKYADDRMRYLNPDTTLMYIDNAFRQQELYASAAGRYTLLPHWDASLAVDYQWNTLRATLQDFVYPKRNTVLTALATAFEWRGLRGQASLLGTFVFEHLTRASHGSGSLPPGTRTGPPDRRQEYTPALFLSFRPLSPHDFSVQTFYKRIFRMPTFNDLYYTDVGNTSLRPEYTEQYDLGCRYVREEEHRPLRRLEVKVDAYFNRVTDKIVAIPKGNGQYRWMMMNLGYVEIRGVDLSGQTGWQLPGDLRLQTGLTYTFQRAQDFSDPTDSDPRAGTYGRQIAYIPWHSGSAIVNLQWKSWDMNYSFIYVGERYHNSSNIRENHEQPWYTHDLTLGRAWTFRAVKVKLSAEINNLLNQYYDVVQNYPMPGRNAKLILRMEL
ncbi:MAG: TonB-dependent receptor plug domain-containing protein [Tannerella sp.]|jgi:outer membrane cobalamin receptor|nr:TonB-dependent receptor plug domain-containing protein [Tannerella sp.]